MGHFVETALSFPAVLFSFLLLVVVGYWILVVGGGLGIDVLDGSGSAGEEVDDGDGRGLSGLLSSIGLGGAPATVVVSVLIAVAWFISLTGAALLDGLALSIVVLLVALAVAWAVARLLLSPLRRLFPADEGPSRHDFIGRQCVIRTSRVGADFGQAEVHAADGSSAIVQVRQTGADELGVGSAAIIYDYDAEGEFFWVVATPEQRIQ